MTDTAPNKKLIYIADDDEVIRDLLTNFCKFAGYEAQGFPNGQACFEAIIAENPAAVISDIHMPFMNGFQLLRATKRVNADIPVLFITGFAHFRRFFVDKTARADGFLEKPFSLESIDNWLKQHVAKP